MSPLTRWRRIAVIAPSRWRFRPSSPLAVRSGSETVRVQPPEATSTYSRPVLGTNRRLRSGRRPDKASARRDDATSGVSGDLSDRLDTSTSVDVSTLDVPAGITGARPRTRRLASPRNSLTRAAAQGVESFAANGVRLRGPAACVDGGLELGFRRPQAAATVRTAAGCGVLLAANQMGSLPSWTRWASPSATSLTIACSAASRSGM